MFKYLNKLTMKLAAFSAIAMLAAPAAHAGWQQTFNENFDGPVDTSKWRNGKDYWGADINPWRGEDSCYDPSVPTFSNGVMSIQAKYLYYTFCSQPADFTSGMLSSLLEQRYGYYEIRLKMPKRIGVEPTLRLTRPGVFPQQPPDIIVTAMSGTASIQAVQGITGGEFNTETFTDLPVAGDFATDFHTFGVDWQADKLVYYVDGVEKSRITDAALVPQDPMYMILELSVGSKRVGYPQGLDPFMPNTGEVIATMEVDSVKVYQRVNDGQPDTLPPGVNPPVPADTVAPSVSITAPLALARIVGDGKKFTAKATATDNVAVTKVEFWLENTLVCTDTAAPYECQITTPKLAKKSLAKLQTLSVRAFDAAGNKKIVNREILIVNVP